MQEIKFRGIYVDTGEFVYGSLILGLTKDPEFEVIFDGTTYYKVKAETVGQFIGDNDNDGNDIFEGELLNSIRGYTGDIYQVIFDLAGFRWFLIYDEHLGRNVSKERRTASLHFGINYKIIGNIHQDSHLLNPELLK